MHARCWMRLGAAAVAALAMTMGPGAAVAGPEPGRTTWVDELLAAREALATQAVGRTDRPLPNLGKSDYTAAAWFRTTAGGTLFSVAPARGRWVHDGKALFIRGGRLAHDIGWVGCIESETRVADGAWHHVALVHRGGDQQIYVDGRPDADGSMDGGPDGRGWVLKFGRTASDFGGDFHGQLDEARLYSRALTAAEVAALASGSAPAPAEGLAGYWPFDGDARDVSGQGHDAALTGRTSFVPGRVGQALETAGGWAATKPSAGSDDPAADAWSMIEGRFPDAASQVEMAIEREDGLWNAPWAPGERAALEKRYREVAGGQATAPVAGLAAAREEYHRRRRAALAAEASPGGAPILFVRRHAYDSNHYYTEYINSSWKPGGGLAVLEPATGAVRELLPAMTNGVFERFDLSFDARRVVFAWKGAPQEGYRIYEVGIDGRGLRQLTFPPANEAELQRKYRVAAHYHHGTDDMMPCYLADGGIAFISTRCQYGILCDAPDDFTTTVLYRMDADGGNLRAISRSSVSEASPVAMPDGRILYTRWEYVDKGAVSVKCLWAMRPDGSGSAEIYGNDIALPPTLLYGRPIPGDPHGYVVLGTPHCPQNGVGTVIRLDTRRPIRTREPMTWMTPDVDIQAEPGFAFREGDGSWRHDGEGRGRLFKDPYPLSASRFLVAHKPAGPAWNADDGYGLYVLDERGGVRLLHREPGISCFLPYPLQPRPVPPVLTGPRDAGLAGRGLAACMVADVYRGLEDVPRGAVRYLRVLEQVPRPWAAQWKGARDCYDQQHIAITKDTHLGLKVQHGVVPVEEDGSAHFVVPAGRNIFLQALDADYRALQTERTYVYYAPGETRSCVGCHETPEQSADATRPAATPLAFRRAPSAPGPQPGEASGGRPLHYPTDVQPVWDRHCVGCHGGEQPKGGLDLRGTPTEFFCVSYENLVPERRRNPRRDRGLLGLIVGENHPKTGNVDYLPAGSLGSRTSVLVAMLARGGVRLADPEQEARARKLAEVHAKVAAAVTPEELLRVSNWVDTNAQYYGSYWGRRHLDYRARADFRRVPTFEEAASLTPPAWATAEPGP